MNFPDAGDLVPAGSDFVGQIITNQQDPQLAYMWEVSVESSDPRNFEKSIQLFARNVTVPQRSVEEIRREYIGDTVVHAGHATDPKQLRITFWDDKRLIGYRYFTDWMNTVSDPQYGRQADATKTRKKVKLLLKDRSDFFVGLTIDFSKAIITNIGDVTLSYDESIPFLFNVSISYDSMILNGTEYSGEANRNSAVQERGLLDSANERVRSTASNIGDKINSATGEFF